jgi:hypothetical protein
MISRSIVCVVKAMKSLDPATPPELVIPRTRAILQQLNDHNSVALLDSWTSKPIGQLLDTLTIADVLEIAGVVHNDG